MSAVLKFETNLEFHNCPVCAVAYAAPPSLFKKRREDGQPFWCPNGHSLSFHETELDKLRQQLEEEKRNAEWYKNSAKTKDTQIKGMNIQIGKVKAKLHRTERRIANGVCPCCHRSFQNVMRHMKTKHPDYVEAPQ